MPRCLSLPTSPSKEALSFFPLRGPVQRRVAGGDSRVLCRSPLLSQLKYQGKWAEVSPHFPFAAGKRVPCVARGAASGGCCLGVAKAKGPWAGFAGFALFACPKAPLLGVLVLPSIGSCGPGKADGFLLCLRNGDASAYQCSTHTGCDCCCTSMSRNIAGA